MREQKARIKLNGQTAAEWTAENPVLLERELGFETDTGQLKFGDGATAWNALSYSPPPPSAPAWGDLVGVLVDQVDLQAALDAKAALAGPALTGVPTAPTAAPGTTTTQLATTAFVSAAVLALIDSSPVALNTLKELADALGDDANYAATVTTALALKAPLASPALTGAPTAPTAAAGTNTTQLATTAFVTAAIAALLGGVSGALDTLQELAAAIGDDANYAATVTTALALKAPLASPALTGTPTAPTAAVGTNTTQIASTAFVLAQAGASAPAVDSVAAAGVSTRYARDDHVHPLDTSSRYPTGYIARASGLYYNGFLNGTNSNGVITLNKLYAVPFYVGPAAAFDRIAVASIGVASSIIRLGIYQDVGGVPVTLVQDCGTVSGAGGGIAEIVINQNLSGMVWLACVGQNVAPSVTRNGSAYWSPYIGSSSPYAIGGGFAYSQTGINAGLPAPWGATLTVENAAGVAPTVWLRKT